MAQLETTFDPSQHEPSGGPRDLVPEGHYPLQVTNTQMKTTKDGSGKYLETRFVITEGEHEGKELSCRFNLVNSNLQAVKIANEQFTSLLLSCGVTGQINDTEVLHGKNCVANVKVKAPKEGTNYGPQNEIPNFIFDPALKEGRAPPMAQAGPAITKPVTANATTAPWKKKSA